MSPSRHFASTSPLFGGGEESALRHPLLFAKRIAKSLEQRAVDRVALRIIFRMPLHAERKARRIGDADRFDGAVLRDAFDDDALAGLEDTLPIQRIDADHLANEQLRKRSVENEATLVPVGADDLGVGMAL